MQYPDNPDFVPSAYGPPEPLKQGDRKFKRQSRPAVVVDDSNRSLHTNKDCNKYKTNTNTKTKIAMKTKTKIATTKTNGRAGWPSWSMIATGH